MTEVLTILCTGRHVRLYKDSNNNLVLSRTKNYPRIFHGDDNEETRVREVLADLLAIPVLEWVYPEEIGALTCGEIFLYLPTNEMFWHRSYEVQCISEELGLGNDVVLVNADNC